MSRSIPRAKNPSHSKTPRLRQVNCAERRTAKIRFLDVNECQPDLEAGDLFDHHLAYVVRFGRENQP